MAWDYLKRGGEIFVGIPHRGQVSTAWAINLLHTLSPHISRMNIFTIQGHPIDVSREALVEKSLASNAEYIFFLDSDIHISQDTLEKLLNLDLPIVSALYYRRQELKVTTEMLTYLPKNIRKLVEAKIEVGMPIFTPSIYKEFLYIDEKGNKTTRFRPVFDGEFTKGQLMEVEGIPFGCCLIKTDVFRKLPRPWFYWTLGRDPSLLEDNLSKEMRDRRGYIGCSEDLYFSLLARKHGYHLLCDTSVIVEHESPTIISREGRVAGVEA